MSDEFEGCGKNHGKLEQRVDDQSKDIDSIKLWMKNHESGHTDDLKQRDKNWIWWVGSIGLALVSMLLNIIKEVFR